MELSTYENETRPITRSCRVLGTMRPEYKTVLSREALDFVAELARRFRPRVEELLTLRRVVQSRFDAGMKPCFKPETAHVRNSSWTCAPLPADLQDRRVEITGPVDRKMIINALNSGASVFMADLEDSNAPTWSNVVDGQVNLYDAVRRSIEFVAPTTGKEYKLNDETAVLMVRPRGWHLWEKHVSVDGKAVPAALFDFGLYFFHNVRELLARGTGPYFYLPKLQSRLEARLWNDVFVWSQEMLAIEQGTIKATVLIETLPAAFEMDEILWELRQHSAGLNCGRWDYIFSYIKTFREHREFVVPDRGDVGMTQPNMAAYTRLCIKTCHRRGVHAMGGMAAQIPIKNDPEANDAAIAKVQADKLREARDGHDGTWVAHPGLVPVAKVIFDEYMPQPNQIDKQLDITVTDADLLALPSGTITEAGLRQNVNVGTLYLEAWLGGQGCVPLYNLMEDAATAEISRTQVWQWIRHGASLDDGREITPELFQQILDEELSSIERAVGAEAFAAGRYREAAELFANLSLDKHFEEFLTLPAYELLRETPQA